MEKHSDKQVKLGYTEEMKVVQDSCCLVDLGMFAANHSCETEQRTNSKATATTRKRVDPEKLQPPTNADPPVLVEGNVIFFHAMCV